MVDQVKILIAGARGMVGSAVHRALKAAGHENFVLVDRGVVDLANQAEVRSLFERERPGQVYLAAAKVGGIHANNAYPADFILQNLQIEVNVIESAFRSGTRKLLFLGSSCIYPRLAAQPIVESSLLTGTLEPTNEPYAIAKIAGIKLCESFNRQFGESHGTDYRSVMPTNLYGPGDNYHPVDSHVIPALIRRLHDAKMRNLPSVRIWGTGSPRREFLFVDDLAAACVHVMNLDKEVYDAQAQPMLSHINIGSGKDLTIGELAELIRNAVGYSGELLFDPEKPDGAPRKLLDSTRLNRLGWCPRVALEQGLRIAYRDFINRHGNEY